MEDEEGEVMEHKPISNSLSRNESKRIVVRPPSAECSTSAYLGQCDQGVNVGHVTPHMMSHDTSLSLSLYRLPVSIWQIPQSLIGLHDNSSKRFWKTFFILVFFSFCLEF